MKKTLGIIGGVGPLATMLLGEMIVKHTKAAKDQDHLPFVISNNTSIPDRTAHILDNAKPSPVPKMVEDGKKLTAFGVDVLAIPCNTAHSFYEEIQEQLDIPVLHMIRETAKKTVSLGVKRVGILATSGTIFSKVYQQAFEEVGVETIIPDNDIQELVMSVIYDDVKAGKPTNRENWETIIHAMEQKGCESFILGCTELSIVREELALSEKYIDSLLVLAEAAIVACGYDVVNPE
ncbi:aspartate/glutamate racemase family protein [Paenisporosarcina cavernae]|uniref:Amino acid racemase n=1 Tax=Paenisporosarcina cavernae TaxID=2320858 RepID=A0A385YUM8_9BACL|nr:amino acid racemase [Paenisporosarcina cavernae]AYC30264.1 amino acid racemase [Paenisporosarcina cavernae]